MALGVKQRVRWRAPRRDSRGLTEKSLSPRRFEFPKRTGRLFRKRPEPRKVTDASSSKTYYKLSNLYDRIFTPVLASRIHSTIRHLSIPAGSTVLDVGVGTGASLAAYPSHCQVIGVDLSHEMLTHAQEKVIRNGWQHIALRQMDALNLDFPNASFDYVMAFHIAAVVPDPLRLMREITRVCKPGGTIAIINHLRSEDRWVGKILDLIDPVTNRLGWQTTLTYDELVRAAPIQVVRRFKTSPHSLFTVVIGTRQAEGHSVVTSEW